MTSAQLAQRLAGYLSVEDPFNIPADVSLDILAAINAGLSRFYAEMPAVYRETTISHVVRAPEAIAFSFQSKYSNIAADSPFSAAMQGCTLRLDGTTPDNEVTGVNTVLDSWLHDQLSVTGTVYYDAVPLSAAIERITSDVRLYTQDSRTPLLLTKIQEPTRSEAAPIPDYRAPGRPRFYLRNSVGQNQGGTPAFFMRLMPLPDADYILRFDAILAGVAIGFADLVTPVALPVADQLAEWLLVPICAAHLVTSRFWREKGQIELVLAKAGEAIAAGIARVSDDVLPTYNRVLTREGF